MNGIPNAAVLKTSMTAFAPTSVRERKMRSGTSGARWRASITMNAASRAAEPA
jgi:hypothetical protein